VLQSDEQDRVTGFLEKPRHLPPGEQVLASMGIYIFDMETLVPALEEDARRETSHDFGKDIIPALVSKVPVYAYRFYDENKKASKYWRDIGTRRRRRSSCSPTRAAAAARRWTRSSPLDASCRAAASRAACSARTCGCTASVGSKTPS
jgi:NDP-sugar pyrophosphorylase family protein